MKHRCSTLPAFLACVTLQFSVRAYETDMWFGTIRPPQHHAVPETGVFWGVGVFGMLLATWQWRRRVRAQGLPKAK